jgi:8-oxo-dGTP pyrophosphatase MutT (NUDIX family)
MPDLMAHFGTYQPDPGWTFYHGTPDVRTWQTGARYGIHVGTREAAKQALEARIGKPHEGEWDGTREYGKTLISRDQVRHEFNPADRTWKRVVEHHEPAYPNGTASYSPDASGHSPKIPLDARPHIFPVRITGPMTNHPAIPHEDFKANGLMAGQIKRGRAKSGYFYRNVSEDEGSISAVVPSAKHLERLDEPKTAGLLEHFAAWYHGTRADLEPGAVIEPGHESSLAPYLREHGITPTQQDDTIGRTFFSAGAGQAARWARSRGDPRLPPAVYEVEPTGPHEPDPGGGGGDYRSRHPLRVVRKVSLLEHFAAAVNPPCFHCGEPLDDEDVAGHNSAHEECQTMRECPVHGEHDDPMVAEQHRDTYTDWYYHLPFAGGIHRGLVKQLPREVHDAVHDESRPSAERAHALRGYLHREGFHGGTQEEAEYGADHEGHLGVHWTPNETAARHWGSDDTYEGPVGMGPKPSVTHVVLHAASPDEDHIETDPDHLEARHMYGFDHERSEHEVPLKYGAPVHLTGISWKHGGQEHWHRHDFGRPSRHLAAVGDPAVPEAFPNPYHGTSQFGGRPEFSHAWFHGTKGQPEDLRAGRPLEDQRGGESGRGWPQPNKLLGTHFSPLHRVAHGFAKGIYPSKIGGGSPGVGSALVHARLHMRNPAHFPTEDHLNLAIAQWADKHHPDWHDDKLNASMQWQYSDSKGTRRNWHEEHLPGGHPNPHGLSDDELAERNWGEEDPSHARYFHRVAGHAQQVLQWHPKLPRILHDFTDDLIRKGHHGITYGNEVEGPGQGSYDGEWDKEFAEHTRQDVRHISAIATRPSQIETTHVEHIAPPKTAPEPHEVEHHPVEPRFWGEDENWQHGKRGYSSELNEDKPMYDRVGRFHAEHGGAYPGVRKQAILPGGDLSEVSKRFEQARVEWVRTDKLMKHREWHHGPGTSRSPEGEVMAPRHTPEEWAANVQSVRDEGIRQPIHVNWDPKSNYAYVPEGNSRLAWAAEAGHEAVPVIGHRHSWIPNRRKYKLPGASKGPEVKERHGNHIPADIAPSEFLPEDYMHHPGKTAAAPAYDGPYYHGTAARLSPGALIEPGHKGHDVSSKKHVYLSATDSVARTFGGLAAVRNKAKTYSIYQVEPTGPVEPDPDGMGHRSEHPLRVVSLHERGASPEDPNPWWNQPGTGKGYPRQASAGPQEFFHGTRKFFHPGQDLTPGHRGGVSGSVMEHVYLTTSQERAAGYAHAAPSPDDEYSDDTPRVYRVRPSGPVEDDSEDGGPGAFRTKAPVRVLEEVPGKGYPKKAMIIDMANAGDDFTPDTGYVECDQGHEHWGPHGASFLLLRHRAPDGHHRYLLQKRTSSGFTDHGGTWALPGGALQHEGEDSYAAARREAAEEMGPLPRMKHHHTVRDDHGGWFADTHVADLGKRFEPKGGGSTSFEAEGHAWFDKHEVDGLKETGALHPGFAKTWDTVRRSRVDKTAAALYTQRVERIHPRDLLPYAQREAWRMQDPAGRRHISDLAEKIRQQGYKPSLHGGMSGDTHSYPPSHPITLVHDDDQSWLWNGHHRTFALNEAGYDKPVPVLVKDFRTARTAVITPGSLPPEQQRAFDTEDLGVHRREMFDLAKNPPPGTRVWRGEMRDETEHPKDAGSVGMHWTANPDALITHPTGEPGKRRVVWQGVVEDHEKQAFPRSHPMWRGIHRSMDWEAEVRFRPGAHVKLEGAYVDHSGNPGYLVPQKPERTSPSWEYHPLGHHVTIKHSGRGAADYSELGIEREAKPAMVP